jgi:hypothetical protein
MVRAAGQGRRGIAGCYAKWEFLAQGDIAAETITKRPDRSSR